MSTFGQGASLAPRQILWLMISLLIYFGLSAFDMSFIRRGSVVMMLYVSAFILLALLLVVAHPVMGARAWFSFGPISFQPADLAKLALIVLLAKYLSRRYVEIGDFRHIIVSALYTGALAFLIVIEPDMGNTIIFGTIWLGMMLVSGISKKHLALLGIIALIIAFLSHYESLPL
jgi:rod shape determining protein RodA